MRPIPKLSILCLTFNHASFIRQALDGFLMQKTNFPFEVLIHDDASTDGTPDIIREYEAKYPEIIKPIYQTENQWSKGVAVSKVYQFPRVKGQYVALCEGDDYWTDPMKLQKQVDFLDAQPDYTVCFHPVEVHWEDDPERCESFPTPDWRFNKTTLMAEDLIQHNFIQTNSVMYRWVFPTHESLDDYPEGILPGDWYLHLVHAKHGKIGFLDDTMAVYRRHAGGIWQNNPLLRHGLKHFHFYNEVDRLLGFQYHESIENSRNGLAHHLLDLAIQYNNYDELLRISLEYPAFKERLLWQILVPRKKFSIRHRIVNRIAKLLGLGSVFINRKWFP